ncbi:VCBS repeat-containing protein [Paenibacillus caui]|uniref:VCBS repeat-containing protein n=1 Tax=Paenibacillus caui TaxID=2873927 RepID=UPI001F286D93|nr:VCBS repeat-containing protein [Paenibacillus caui]
MKSYFANAGGVSPYRRMAPRTVSNAEVVQDRAFGDVTGDGKPDEVLLTGTQSPDSPFVQNITLIVKDGASSAVYRIRLPEPVGYHPTVLLADFTGEGRQDILVQIDSGGSGAITYDDVYHFANGSFRHIFNSEHLNQQWKYRVDYLDGYKLQVTSEATGETYTIDISGRGKDYLDQIYNPDGTLKQPVQGFVDPVSGLYPVDTDRDGKYSLMAFQGVSGLYHADRFGYIVSLLDWTGGGWKLTEQWFSINGM